HAVRSTALIPLSWFSCYIHFQLFLVLRLSSISFPVVTCAKDAICVSILPLPRQMSQVVPLYVCLLPYACLQHLPLHPISNDTYRSLNVSTFTPQFCLGCANLLKLQFQSLPPSSLSRRKRICELNK
ncbi:hypothetical protein L9F63_026709, partial [Diploptera punctata]